MEFGTAPAEGLFEHAEGVLDLEPAQERRPQQGDLVRSEVGTGVPQPHRA